MPTNKRKTTRQIITLGVFEILHLLQSCCFCGCRLCHGPQGVCPAGITAWTLKDFARDTWQQHRDALLEIWRTKPVGARQAGFQAAAYRGYGHWFPCFAEVVFDGAEWPAKNPKWPAEVKKAWVSINCHLKG